MNFSQTYPRLLGDIGGTNARFAMQTLENGPLINAQALPCKNYENPIDAIKDYLETNMLPSPVWAAIGIATDVSSDAIKMTNNHWRFSKNVLRNSLGVDLLEILNDFTSLAFAIPTLKQDQLQKIGAGTPDPKKPCGLIGAGTGLGISGLIAEGGKIIPLSGEGGHATLPAFNSYEAELISILREEFEHVSAERVLSGPGIENLHRAILQHAGFNADDPRFNKKAHEITEAGITKTCDYARKTLDVFCEIFGTVSSDLALTLGAKGGLYIGGGVIPKLGDFFEKSGFRRRFENKGRFSSYLREIPTWVINDQCWPGIIGAANSLDQAHELMMK